MTKYIQDTIESCRTAVYRHMHAQLLIIHTLKTTRALNGTEVLTWRGTDMSYIFSPVRVSSNVYTVSYIANARDYNSAKSRWIIFTWPSEEVVNMPIKDRAYDVAIKHMFGA